MKKSHYNKYHFCSVKCRQDWYANVYSQTEEYREKCRERAVKLLQDGCNNRTNSKPQQEINLLLDKMNVNYVNEKSFVYYAVDNYLFDYNLIIEVMGDFWHCHPLIYTKEKINNIQKNRIAKDKSKHSYIYNNYDIEILYLWEFDIINNIKLCELLIDMYIKNNGKLKNYHSFNYLLDGENISYTNEVIIPYQDLTSI